MVGDDVLYLTVEELGERIRAKSLSPVELTEGYLARIARLAPRYNAFATVTADLARQQARQAESELAAGQNRGPLHGIPYGAKDLVATKGIPTTWGARPYRHQVFDYDATVVQKLRAAGAVLLGKLAMVELAGGLGYHFANASLQGPGRNPWDPGRWTGGSSSGPGAAVASGLVAFAVGSETWGSIVCPSAFCGVSGLRPTYGRVSRHGAMALSWTMDKLGPMARSARDCRTVLTSMAGLDANDPTTSFEPLDFAGGRDESREELRIGYLPLDFSKNGEKEVDRAVHAAVHELEGAGFKVGEAKLPSGPWEEVAIAMISVEAVSSYEPLFRSGEVRQLTEPKARFQEQIADQWSGRDFVRAQRARRALQERLPEIFRDHDLLVAPSMQYVSTPIDADLNTALAGPDPLGAIGNLCGLPAISVPCGVGAHGLPVGMVIVGPPYGEDEVLRVAEAYQKRTDWHHKHPPTG